MYLARRAEPCANRHLAEVETKKRLESHRKRMATIKPSIDTKIPASAMLSTGGRNAKREYMMEGTF